MIFFLINDEMEKWDKREELFYDKDTFLIKC